MDPKKTLIPTSSLASNSSAYDDKNTLAQPSVKPTTSIALNSENSTKRRRKSRAALCCCFFSHNKCFISLWSTLYSILIVALHIYLIQSAIQKCISLNKKDNLFDLVMLLVNTNSTQPPRPAYANSFTNQSPNAELITRLCLISLSIIFLFLFLFLFRNYVATIRNQRIRIKYNDC